MPTRSVVIGFLAGIGVAILIGGRFWAPDASDRPAPLPIDMETVAEAAAAEEPVGGVPVDETETLVADDEAVVDPTPEPVAALPVARREPAPRPVVAPPAREPVREPVVERTAAPEVVSNERPEPAESPTENPARNDDAWARSEPSPAESTDADAATADRPVSAAVIESREPRAWEPAPLEYEELILSADSVISLQVDSSISTETARVEDRVEARTIRDVNVGSETAIPAGSLAVGSVTLVEVGGKIKEQARLGIRFHTLVLDDGTAVPLQTETIYREGRAPGKESTAKIGGGAAAGAILGGIFGGKRGAVIGGAIGAGGGTAATMAGGRNPATLPAGTPVTIRLQEPATVTVER